MRRKGVFCSMTDTFWGCRRSFGQRISYGDISEGRMFRFPIGRKILCIPAFGSFSCVFIQRTAGGTGYLPMYPIKISIPGLRRVVRGRFSGMGESREVGRRRYSERRRSGRLLCSEKRGIFILRGERELRRWRWAVLL